MSRMLGRSKKEFKITFALSRCNWDASFAKSMWVEFGKLVTKSSSMHCWNAFRLEVLGSAEFWYDGCISDSEEEEKMFLFSLLSHRFANNIIKQSIFMIRVFILYRSMTIENSFQELTTFSYAGSFSGTQACTSVVWLLVLCELTTKKWTEDLFLFVCIVRDVKFCSSLVGINRGCYPMTYYYW